MVDVHVSPCEHGCASGVRVDIAREFKVGADEAGGRRCLCGLPIPMYFHGWRGAGLELTLAAWMGRLELVLVTWVEPAFDGWWEGR